MILMSRRPWLPALLLPFAALLGQSVSAQRLTPINELAAAVGDRALPFQELEAAGPLADCSTETATKLRQMSAAAPGMNYQWINGRSYSWQLFALETGQCVYLAQPEGRGLSRNEARIFLSATQLTFPVANPQTHVAACGRGAPPAAFLGPMPVLESGSEEPVAADVPIPQGGGPSADLCDEEEPVPVGKSATSPGSGDPRSVLSQTSYPYYSLALTDFRGPVYSSAVQISPYVYVTAAHVVLEPQSLTLRQRGGVRPRYRLPQQTNKIPAAVISWHPGYTFSNTANDLMSDLAFIKVTEPHDLARYPGFFLINSAAERYFPTYANIGDPDLDIFYAGYWPGLGGTSWFEFNRPGADFTETIVAGYPNFVNNTFNSNNNPYYDAGDLYGQGLGYQLGRINSARFLRSTNFVSAGNSGGPIFGKQTGRDYYTLLGVVSSRMSANTADLLGTGHLDLTDNFFRANVGWTPGSGVLVNAPQNGAQYAVDEVPTFSADAGANTAQLQWFSDIDGYLGSGGSLTVNNQLSLGVHQITCRLGDGQRWQSGPGALAVESEQSASSDAIRVLEIEIVPAIPEFDAYPNPVLVPPGANSAQTTLSWISPTFANIDIYRVIDGNKVKLLDNGQASGALPADVFLRKTNVFQLYAHGNTSNVLKSISVYGKPQPWMKAEPETVLVPADAQNARTTISWGDVDSASVRLLVSIDGAAPTEVAHAPNSYSVPVNWITAGRTFVFRLYPAGNTSGAPLHTVTVRGVGGQITATPNPVLVPAGQASRNFDLAWDVPLVGSVDIWASRNGATPVKLGAAMAATGSSLGNNSVAPGDVVHYWIYEAGRSAPLLATTMVRGESAGPASLSASPNPVLLKPGEVTKAFNLAWNAPGHAAVDIYAERNGQGRIKLGSALPASGSSIGNNSVSLGERIDYWLYPAGDTTTLLATLRVTGQRDTPGASFSAGPNPVVVPYGQANAPFDLYWDIPGYASIDIYAERNGPPRVKLASNAAASGSSLGSNFVAATDRVTYWIYPAGATTPLLATLQVNGQAGATPAMTAVPNPVVIPAGQTSRSYDLYWEAPGYSRVDIYAERNGPPRVQLAAGVAASGNSIGSNSVAVGDTVTYWIYPEGDTSTVLATLQVIGRH